MKKFNKLKGDLGEEQAVNFLNKNKYKIISRNYKNKTGEIDIIAKLKKMIVFVEVKNRSSIQFGLPCEAVDTRKQNKIRSVAQMFILQNRLDNKDIRFDVIEILDGEINHIENAF